MALSDLLELLHMGDSATELLRASRARHRPVEARVVHATLPRREERQAIEALSRRQSAIESLTCSCSRCCDQTQPSQFRISNSIFPAAAYTPSPLVRASTDAAAATENAGHAGPMGRSCWSAARLPVGCRLAAR